MARCISLLYRSAFAISSPNLDTIKTHIELISICVFLMLSSVLAITISSSPCSEKNPVHQFCQNCSEKDFGHLFSAFLEFVSYGQRENIKAACVNSCRQSKTMSDN